MQIELGIRLLGRLSPGKWKQPGLPVWKGKLFRIEERLVGADASHAWPSVFIPGWGWLDVDPTNDQLVGSSYVTTAWGRDYADVSPLKGIVFGGGDSHTLHVSVDVTRSVPVGHWADSAGGT